MLKRARLSLPSPRHRERSWMEYFEENIARTIRSSRELPASSFSMALRGSKRQQTVANTRASNNGSNPESNGQLMKTEVSYAGIKERYRGSSPGRRLFAGCSINSLSSKKARGSFG